MAVASQLAGEGKVKVLSSHGLSWVRPTGEFKHVANMSDSGRYRFPADLVASAKDSCMVSGSKAHQDGAALDVVAGCEERVRETLVSAVGRPQSPVS